MLSLGLAMAALGPSCTSITGLDELTFDTSPELEGCVPGTQSPCYSGPDGTDGVGPCRSGEHTCLSDRASFSECFGEVIPLAEDCYTKALEACGMEPCPGFAAWSFSYGTTGSEQPVAMAATDSGGAVVASVYTGDDPSQSSRIDLIGPGGTITTTKKFEGINSNPMVRSLAVSASQVVVAGYFEGMLNLGDGAIASMGSTDALVAQFDSKLLTLQNKLTFGSVELESLESVAVGPAGIVAVGGQCTGDFSIDALAVPALGGGSFVAVLDASLAPRWAQRVGPQPLGFVSSAVVVAFDSDGDLLVTGSGTIEPCSNDTNQGAYLAKLAAEDGSCIWSVALTGPDPADPFDQPYLTAIAVGPQGPLIAGRFYSSFTIDAEPAVTGSGVFVTQLSHEGAVVWTQTLAMAAGQFFGDYTHLATTPAGTYVAGHFAGTLTAGTIDPIESIGGSQDLFVVLLDPSGAPLWATRFGDDKYEFAGAIAATPDGAPLLAGSFEEVLELGQDPLTSQGSLDNFVARLNP